ncbi:hypothetical protein QL285_037990 [Trifolium repens]|nr:hypothetical protein QL285_037990 [Trifolium repens]
MVVIECFHDRGGFFFLLRLPGGGDRRFLPIPVVIVVVGGGYSLLRADVPAGSLRRRFVSGARAPSVGRVASPFLSRQVCSFEFSGLYNWAIYSFGPISLFLGLTPVHSPLSTRLKEAKW